MQQEELVEFIKEELSKGASQEIIQEMLKKFGYLPEEINRLMQSAFEKTAPGINPEAPELPKKEFTPVAPAPRKNFFLPLILLVVFIFVAGGAVFAYYNMAKLDPISMLPKDTFFFVRFKVNPEEEQVKNLKEILNNFPYYEKISKIISDEFNKSKEKSPALKNLDFTISDEVILAYTAPYSVHLDQIVSGQNSLVLIIPDPDLKKLKALADDIQKEIEKNKNWKIEKGDYKGRTILKITPQESTGRGIVSTFTNGNFVLAMDEANIKKIIDTADDQEITSVFKQDKSENIKSNPAFSKLKKYSSGDFLALFYGQMSLSEALQSAAEKEAVRAIGNSFPQLQASLEAALNLPFLKKEDNASSEAVAFIFKIFADKSELKTEGYSLDLRKDAILSSQFSLADSLSQYLPDKIAGQDVIYFAESSGLKNTFELMKESLAEEKMSEEKINKFLVSLNEALGVDLEKDILPLFEKNYAFVLATEATGKEMPIFALVSEVNNGKAAEENLLKINILKEALDPLGGARQKAKDVAIKATLDSLRVTAELIYDESYYGSYQNVYCGYNSNMTSICNSIKTQIGSKPVIRASSQSYCAYSPLNEKGAYFCVDSTGMAQKTYINPGGKGYCTWTTFRCPSTQGEPPSAVMEKVGFTKETIDGFEIYSLPVSGDFSLSFTTDDNKIIFTLSTSSLASMLKSLNDSGIKRLKDSAMFVEQFNGTPQEISNIIYVYPYGFSGALKYLASFLYNSMGSEYLGESAQNNKDQITAAISELIDKGIAPYLKVIKTEGSYSYNLEKGLSGQKVRIIIKELSSEEKKSAEEFWQNIKSWIDEKSQLIYPRIY